MISFTEFLELDEATFTSRAKIIHPDHPTKAGASLNTYKTSSSNKHPEEKIHTVSHHKLTLNEPDKFDHNTHSDESEHHINRIVRDIKAGKKIDPVKAVRGPQGRLHVIDGHHRIEALRRTGNRKVPVNIISSSIKKVVDDL